jgi:hypothetical protein
MEIAEHNKGNPKSTLSHFRPKVEIEHNSSDNVRLNGLLRLVTEPYMTYVTREYVLMTQSHP